MKKLLAFIMVLCMITVPVFAEGGITATDATLSVNGITMSDFQSGYASIESTFKNNGSTDTTVTVVIAEYTDASGVLIMNNVGIESKTIPAGKSAKIVPGLQITSDTSLIKYFAYAAGSLEPIGVGNYHFENFEFIGTENGNTYVYKVNRFEENDPTVDNTPCEALSAPAVCSWEDNKTAAVSITIDDGNYASAVRYNELQKTYGVHSTQFIITNKLTDKDGWKAIFADGYMDMGNHSASHSIKYSNDTYTDEQLAADISGSQTNLLSIFPGEDVFTFATPWGQTPDNVVTELKKSHYANRNAGGGVLQSKTPSDFFKIPCVVVQYGTTLSKLNGYVDTAVTSGGWCVELLHAIGADGSADTAYSSKYSTIEDHYKYIKQKSDAGSVWSGSFNDVVKYIYERDTAKAKILWSTNSSVGIKVTDGMADDELFDYPLTFKVNIPLSWNGSVKVTQNGKTSTSTITTENGKKYALVKIVPDSGNAVITNK